MCAIHVSFVLYCYSYIRQSVLLRHSSDDHRQAHLICQFWDDYLVNGINWIARDELQCHMMPIKMRYYHIALWSTLEFLSYSKLVVMI